MISILLSHSLTICNCKKLEITPFKILYTYLNIPDKIGEKSLFEAEVIRMNEYINNINKIDGNKLIIIDELFSSTNYHEGISTAYSICKYLSKHKNSINIITTHYQKLKKISHQRLLPNYLRHIKLTSINLHQNLLVMPKVFIRKKKLAKYPRTYQL